MTTAPDAVIAHQARYERIFQETGIEDAPGFYRWVARLIRPRQGQRLLDVACGEGGLLLASREQGAAAWGIDISQQALQRSRVRAPDAPLVLGSAEQLPFQSGAFDIVVCLGSLENFADPVQALAELHRVTAPGGAFYAMMPNKLWLGDTLSVLGGGEEQIPFQPVERLATIRQWRRMLEREGFAVQRADGYVKRSPLFQGRRLRSVKKFLLSHALAWCCPPSLAWSILFTCRKTDRPAPGAAGDRAWVWKMEWLGR